MDYNEWKELTIREQMDWVTTQPPANILYLIWDLEDIIDCEEGPDSE